MDQRKSSIREIIIRDILIALPVAVIAGIVVAYFAGEGRFAPRQASVDATQAFLRVQQPVFSSNRPGTASTATPQSFTPSFPNIIVSANANNGVQFIALTSGNYQFTIQEGIYCTPSICRSIIHGYLGRDIVWKDWYGLPHPMDQDYEIGCWEGPTAKNKNCAAGMSVIVYMKAQQYIRWVIMEDKDAFADNNGAVILAVTLIP